MIHGEAESRWTPAPRTVGVALLLVTMMTACSEEITGPGVMLPITTIYPSRLQGRPFAGNEAVQSQSQWQLVWNDIHHDFSSVPPLPLIDFSYQTVLVASRGPSNTCRCDRFDLTRSFSSDTYHALLPA